MWAEKLALAAIIRGPIEPQANGEGEIAISVSASNAVIKIPDWLAGKYAEFTAAGASCDVLCGLTSSVSVTYGQASTVDGTTKVVTANAATGRHIADGSTRAFLVPTADVALYIAVAASGSGKLYIGVSSRRIAVNEGK